MRMNGGVSPRTADDSHRAAYRLWPDARPVAVCWLSDHTAVAECTSREHDPRRAVSAGAGTARVGAHSGAGSISAAARRAARTGLARHSSHRDRARLRRHRLAADAVRTVPRLDG